MAASPCAVLTLALPKLLLFFTAAVGWYASQLHCFNV